MTIGNLGAARVPPKPGSATLNEALGLLAAFGGGDPALRSLLTEMRDTQAINDQLVKDAGQAVSDANVRELSAQDAESKARTAIAELDGKTAEAQRVLDGRSADLDAQEAKLASWATDLKAAEDSAHADLERREQALREREAALVNQRAEIEAMKPAAEQILSEAQAIKASAEATNADAQSRLAKLVAFATGTN